MVLSASVTNKLVLARHLYWMATDNLKSQRDVALFAAVNLLQDSIEAFLIAVSEHINAGIDSGTTFERYLTKIDERIAPKQLPFRSNLVALNKIRIAAKHHGVKPDRTEAQRFSLVLHEFFGSSSELIFAQPFWSISLLDLLDDGEIKTILHEAKQAFENEAWFDTMSQCRKVLFLHFEKDYDVEKFKDGDTKFGLFSWTLAPHFAAQSSYIDENVHAPFDYIVVDHQRLNADLLEKGIDPQTYWNLWRLTPAVYRFREEAGTTTDWLVKRELKKESEATEENATYVLEHTIDMSLHLAQRRRLIRSVGYGKFFIRLKSDGTNVYSKADRGSIVSAVTSPGLRQIDADYSTPGLDGKGTYWHVTHTPEGGSLAKDGAEGVKWYWGFVHEDDVDWPIESEPTLPLSQDVNPLADS